MLCLFSTLLCLSSGVLDESCTCLALKVNSIFFAYTACPYTMVTISNANILVHTYTLLEVDNLSQQMVVDHNPNKQVNLRQISRKFY